MKHRRVFFELACVAPLALASHAIAENGTQILEQETEQNRQYIAFFSEVAGSREVSGFVDVQLNGGQRARLYQPSAEEALGLTAEEGMQVRQAASECLHMLDKLNRATAALRKEAFFQRIESGRAEPELEKRLMSAHTERNRLVGEALATIRTAVGPTRFESLRNLVTDAGTRRLFFSTAGVPRPIGSPAPAR